jgi:hypothetical protein
MITLVYDVVLGYISLFFFDEICTYIKNLRGEPVHTCIGFAWLRRLRVRHLEYWHPE